MAELEAGSISMAAGGGGRLRNALSGVLCAFTLLLIGVLAFSIRLFSVIKYESVIHEFDPYFNYRVTQFLSKSGIYEFWNWFDDRTWYPLGRVIGGTVAGEDGRARGGRGSWDDRWKVVLGTLLAALVPVVGFNAILTSEHFASFLVFIILHVVALVYYIKGLLTPRLFKVAMTFVLTVGLALCFAVVAVLAALVASSPTKGWSGRSLSLLDPTYASKYIPIIASVSEHQPPTWPSYFMAINVLAFLVPAGIISCFLPLSDASSFLVLYLVTSVYFSGVMVRLMLVLAPAVCILSGIALSEAFNVLTRSMKFQRPISDDTLPTGGDSTPGSSSTATITTSTKNANIKKEKMGTISKERSSKKSRKETELVGSSPVRPEKEEKLCVLPSEASAMGILFLIMLCGLYVIHCVWAAAEAYSAPSIVLTSRSHNGLHVYDDFRESYAWLRHNTEVDDKVASWWDYGYQTTAMANRTVIVDNNTWNNTHIATVGTAMSSPEKGAWEIFNSLDVKYVLVVFGGLSGYPSDDINKFLWMVRIGGGEFPHIKEQDYLRDGNYRVDAQGTPTMLNCLMYKLCYYRFAETDGKGFDRARKYEIGRKHFKLTHFEEVFTTQHWMVRIYKLKPQKNRVRGKLKLKLKYSSKTSLMRKGAGKKNPWQ
ncbi:hypothetical protein CFC21_042014 [Triticum aestivum]|uniref:dolichyl-diphosphooligosaccharide--protein glycotransferase n=2 Tax=Triticum aestivum TaxID=4565 RepID=A0A9R1FJZ2_WHEAT|nr:dolichyl-diphosphooligosaccharide--protein glycosyltransferase subunit STT3A-like [Triticum aestivum]XP_044349843.1 dolichyl-diphosphooligosaccharide--protein glycosyltransferase subunit STT3A-like [Triticum aestivum]KAF7030477.1 hypothetical protein CFC21_042014 [Triticum aestivum]CDM84058.1 unnamed protein product [Triticum aestivum]